MPGPRTQKIDYCCPNHTCVRWDKINRFVVSSLQLQRLQCAAERLFTRLTSAFRIRFLSRILRHPSMNKTPNFLRRNKAPNIENKPIILNSEVTLECGNRGVRAIACVSTHELIAVATYRSNEVKIFGYNNQGESNRVFLEHKRGVTGLVHVCDDVLASVDKDGMLLTWRATTGVLLDQLKVSNKPCWCIAKASTSRMLVGTADGQIVIVEHSNGTKLQDKKRCTSAKERSTWDIRACNGIFVAVVGGNVQVWNESSGELLHSIENNPVQCVAVSDDFIVTGDGATNLYIHRIRDEYNLQRKIELRRLNQMHIWDRITHICFLNKEIVIVTMANSHILFVSVESGQCISHCISHCKKENSDASKELVEMAVLSDGRVCIGRRGGYCSILKPPHGVEDYIIEYNQSVQASLLGDGAFFSPPPYRYRC